MIVVKYFEQKVGDKSDCCDIFWTKTSNQIFVKYSEQNIKSEPLLLCCATVRAEDQGDQDAEAAGDHQNGYEYNHVDNDEDLGDISIDDDKKDTDSDDEKLTILAIWW